MPAGTGMAEAVPGEPRGTQGPDGAGMEHDDMADLQRTWSDSYASFDVSEWVATDDGREPSTVTGSGDEETLELTAMPDAMAHGLHDAAEHLD